MSKERRNMLSTFHFFTLHARGVGGECRGWECGVKRRGLGWRVGGCEKVVEWRGIRNVCAF